MAALPTTGALSIQDIATKFSISAKNLAAFYGVTNGIPTSGAISIGDFRGKDLPAGQRVFTSAGTFNFTVPGGVTSISMVAVQTAGGAATTVTVNSVLVCRAQNGARIGDGGGDGGAGGDGSAFWNGYAYENYQGGGGGAGGYSGSGGRGGTMIVYGPGDFSLGNTSGSGGGGGGGPPPYFPSGQSAPIVAAGGVGLLGIGPSGSPGNQYGSPGTPGSNGTGRLYGGGRNYGGPYGSSGISGGALAYKNNVAVTPGQTVQIVISPGPNNNTDDNNGAVRIIWGEGRAYPGTNTTDK